MKSLKENASQGGTWFLRYGLLLGDAQVCSGGLVEEVYPKSCTGPPEGGSGPLQLRLGRMSVIDLCTTVVSTHLSIEVSP
jgi:hypothetical protein